MQLTVLSGNEEKSKRNINCLRILDKVFFDDDSGRLRNGKLESRNYIFTIYTFYKISYREFMSLKIILKKIQARIPETWLFRVQNFHAKLLYGWLITKGSKSLSVSDRPALVFSPHQDDETFGCGGIIALKREAGVRVGVVFLTDGGGSGGFENANHRQIVETRKQEAIAALNILGVGQEDIYFFDRPDGGLPDIAPELEAATISEITNLISKYKAEELYVPHYKDCHRDHEATYKLVKQAIACFRLEKSENTNLAIELWQYPIWVFWRAPFPILLKLKDIANAYRISITPVQTKKHQAIASYHSQLAALPPGFVNRFLDSKELFFK